MFIPPCTPYLFTEHNGLAVRVLVSAIPGIKPDIMNQCLTAVTLTVSGFPFVVPVYPEPVQVTAGVASLGRRLVKLKPAEVST